MSPSQPETPPQPTPSTCLVTLDGSQGEGGGQVLRTALSLAMLTGRPFRIVKVRANRRHPACARSTWRPSMPPRRFVTPRSSARQSARVI